MAEITKQLDVEPPPLKVSAAPGVLRKALSEWFGGNGLKKPTPNPLAEDELLALVAQLPEFPLTLDEAPPAWIEELPLQLYANTTLGVGFRTKNIPAMEIVIAIVQLRFMCSQRMRIDKNTVEIYTEVLLPTGA